MNDISKLIVGIAAGIFVSFGLYYGVILKNEFGDNTEQVEIVQETNTNAAEDKKIIQNPDEETFSLIYSNPDAATFSYYSQKIDLTKEFESGDEVSVFVPSNEALTKFEVSKKIPEDDTEKILTFLNSHIVKEKINIQDIKVGDSKQYTTMSGVIINLSRGDEGTLLLNNNKIMSVENNGRDGIFYITDFVIEKSFVPQVSPSPTPSGEPSVNQVKPSPTPSVTN